MSKVTEEKISQSGKKIGEKNQEKRQISYASSSRSRAIATNSFYLSSGEKNLGDGI